MKFYAFVLVLSAFICLVNADIICSNGFQLVSKKCWALVRQKKGWTNGENMCRFTDGAVLVQPQTSDENKLLMDFLAGTGVTSVWMGMQCFGNKLSDCQWDDGSNPGDHNGYSNFKGSPTDGVFSFDTDTGKWVETEGGKVQQFVCELPPTTRDCNANCGVSYNNYCYKLYDMQKNFNDAESYCRSKNSYLVSLHSWLEERFVTQLYRDQGSYWIGGKMDKDTLDITWLDGTNEDGSPDKKYETGNCVQIDVDNDAYETGWFGRDCSDSLIFICKRHAFC